jgi:hypothetical protein
VFQLFFGRGGYLRYGILSSGILRVVVVACYDVSWLQLVGVLAGNSQLP